MEDLNNENDDEKQLSENAWQKLNDKSKTIGYREGLSDGKDSVYQKYFDVGYCNGFKVGFQLGKYKGLFQCQEYHKSLKISDENRSIANSILTNTTKGLCKICENNSLLNSSTKELNDIQLKYVEKKFKNLELNIQNY